jgi:hypothetical protein
LYFELQKNDKCGYEYSEKCTLSNLQKKNSFCHFSVAHNKRIHIAILIAEYSIDNVQNSLQFSETCKYDFEYFNFNIEGSMGARELKRIFA